MFKFSSPIFDSPPDFEKLPVRVEVEWQGRVRPVVAHLEQSPAKTYALLLCALEDEPENGEWLVFRSSKEPYLLKNPEELLRVQCDVLGATQREFSLQLKWRTVTRLARAVSNAFRGRGLQVARVLELHELPHEPRIAVLFDSKAFWRSGWQVATATPFRPGFSSLEGSQQGARELLLREWNHQNSDTRFSWQWAGWNDEERKLSCCGFEGDLRDMARVMRWVLTCSTQLWEAGSSWTWTIHPEFASRGYVTNFSDSGRRLVLFLSAWQEWLFAHFAPGWRADWMKRHECVQEFWRRTPALESVRMGDPPTFHEQLEARLLLRGWLQGKATPDETRKLLGILDVSTRTPSASTGL